MIISPGSAGRILQYRDRRRRQRRPPCPFMRTMTAALQGRGRAGPEAAGRSQLRAAGTVRAVGLRLWSSGVLHEGLATVTATRAAVTKVLAANSEQGRKPVLRCAKGGRAIAARQGRPKWQRALDLRCAPVFPSPFRMWPAAWPLSRMPRVRGSGNAVPMHCWGKRA